jgi:hypothetical protein
LLYVRVTSLLMLNLLQVSNSTAFLRNVTYESRRPNSRSFGVSAQVRAPMKYPEMDRALIDSRIFFASIGARPLDRSLALATARHRPPRLMPIGGTVFVPEEILK